MKDNDLRSNGAGAPGQEANERPLPKRFYSEVNVECGDDGAWGVLLDGRRVRTPARNALTVPAEDLAHAIGAEWSAQETVIDPAGMPLTRIVNSALDGVTGKETKIRAEIAKFAGNDLVCYRAEHPQELVARQSVVWDGPMNWLRQEYGVRLRTGGGIMPIRQDEASIATFHDLLAASDALELAALHVMVTLSGSAVLGVAVLKDHMAAEEAWQAAHIDEDWQIEQWGEDYEAQARRAFRWQEFAAAAQIINLLKPRW